MTKKKNLTAFMIAIIVMLFSLPSNAQGTVGYVEWDGANTLTFKGGASVPTNGAYALNTDSNKPGWISDVASGVASSCTNVVFDASFNDVRPTSCFQWFQGFSKLSTIKDIRYLNTDNVKTMQAMFDGCSGLTTLDVSKFNTANVTHMIFMFNGCSSLTSLNLSNFNTANVEYMYYMFNGCSSLTSLDLSSFNTDKVTDMERMFYGCSGLTSLDLSSFNTAKVTEMDYMFNGCSKLTSLDLSSFNTAKVTDMYSMFYGCSKLTKIYVSDDFTTDEVSYSNNMFKNCTSLNGKVPYNSDEIDKKMANYNDGYFTKSNLTPYVKWDGVNKVLTFKVANTKEAGSDVYDLNEGANTPGWSIDEVKNYCTKVVFTPSFNHAKPTSCYKWFNMFSGLTTIQGIENLNTEEVTNMSYMFYVCQNLTELDLSSFNTANVTNMSCMFCWCSRPTSLNLSSFNTAKVENMSYMFSYCSGLTTIYASDAFTTSAVSNGSGMFTGCSNLKGATSYNPGKTGIDMANFDGYFTPKTITPYVKWDANTKVLTFKVANKKEEGSGVYDLNEGAKDPGWVGEVYSDCEKVVFTPSFKQAKPTSCYRWFLGFSKPTTIQGIENLNTEKVTNMSEMFNSCSGLKNLDLSSFNTAKVTDMGYMFGGCYDLISLDLSSFNTAKVTDMTWMFYNCQSLTTIYASDGFTTGEVSSSDGMFESCFVLEGATPWDITKTGIDMANYKDGYFKTYFTLGENKVELCGNPLTTKSLDLTGDYDFTPKYEFKAKTATYSRDLSTSGSTWFSLCLPFAYTPDNFTAYQLKGATADAVEIEEITGTIAAGTPVLFKFKDGVVDVDKIINISKTEAEIVKAPVDGTAVTGTDGSSLQLCGTYQTKTFSKDADGNAFILLNDKLMNPARMLTTPGVTKVSVKPFRAYMTLTASAQTSSARAFSIGRGDEGNEGTTAIDLLNSVATDDAEYYDINGRRIDAPAKGVNIVRRGNKTMKLIIVY